MLEKENPTIAYGVVSLWAFRDSNPGPSRSKRDALNQFICLKQTDLLNILQPVLNSSMT